MSFRKFVSSVFSSGLVVAPALTTAYFAFVNGDVEVLDSTSRVPVLDGNSKQGSIQEPQEITPTPAPVQPAEGEPSSSSSSGESSKPLSPDSGSGQSDPQPQQEGGQNTKQENDEEQDEEEESESEDSGKSKTPSLLPKTPETKPKIQFAG